MATHIMVIDDEPLICRLLEYQLGGAGYRVEAYQRPYDAVLQLSRAQPDLILLDVMMPEISGWDLCRQIRASSTIPIIMLTAKGGDDDVVQGLTSGADDYVSKPFSEAQLVARIEAVLRRAQSPAAHPRGATPPRGPRPPHLAHPHPASAHPHPASVPLHALAAAAQPPGPTRGAHAPLPRLGPSLAAARREKGLTLHDAGQASGVRWEFLQAIENEEFGYLPRGELRSALQIYGSFLGVDLKPYAERATLNARAARRPPLATLPLTIGMVAMIALALVFVAFLL